MGDAVNRVESTVESFEDSKSARLAIVTDSMRENFKSYHYIVDTMPDGNGRSQNAPEPFRYTLVNDAPHPMSLLNPEVSKPDLNRMGADDGAEETDAEIARRYRKKYGHHDSHDSDIDADLNSWG